MAAIVVACGGAGSVPPSRLGEVDHFELSDRNLRIAYATSWLGDGVATTTAISADGKFAIPRDAYAVSIFIDDNGDEMFDGWNELSSPCVLDDAWRCDVPRDRLVVRDVSDEAGNIGRDFFVVGTSFDYEVCDPDGANCAQPTYGRRGQVSYIAPCDPHADLSLWRSENEARTLVPLPYTAAFSASVTTEGFRQVEIRANARIDRGRVWIGTKDNPRWQSDLMLDGNRASVTLPGHEIARCRGDSTCAVWIQAGTIDRIERSSRVMVEHLREAYIVVTVAEHES